MRWSKRAGWDLPAGSYSYIHSDYLYPQRPKRKVFKYAKITAALAAVLVAGIIFNGHNAREIASRKVSAAALPVPAAVIKPKPDVSAQLQNLLDSWAAANGGDKWGISVHQLDGNSTTTYHAGQSFYPASIYKLLILQSLFEKFSYSTWNRTAGKGLSYAGCIDRMIRLSDNNCGVAMGNLTGWTVANQRLKSMGLTGTVLNASDKQLRTTAADVELFLEHFYYSYDYPQAKAAVMKAMASQVYRDGIPAGSPGCTVYDKIGDLNGVRHDAAIVDCGSVKYSLVVMSQGGSYAQIADIARQINHLLVTVN